MFPEKKTATDQGICAAGRVAYDLRSKTSGQTDLARLRAGPLGGQFWSVFVPGDGGATLRSRILGRARPSVQGAVAARGFRRFVAEGRTPQACGKLFCALWGAPISPIIAIDTPVASKVLAAKWVANPGVEGRYLEVEAPGQDGLRLELGIEAWSGRVWTQVASTSGIVQQGALRAPMPALPSMGKGTLLRFQARPAAGKSAQKT